MGAAARLEVDVGLAADADRAHPSGAARRLHRHAFHQRRVGIQFVVRDVADGTSNTIFLGEMLPGLRKVGVFINPDDSFSRTFRRYLEDGGRTLGLQVEVLPAQGGAHALRADIAIDQGSTS